MTEKGREFTVQLKRKAALKGKEEFRLQLVSFEKSIPDIWNPEVIRSELQKLKRQADNAIQGFIDWMNLTAETREINYITSEQYKLQSSWEEVRATALSRLEFLEIKDETKSNLSYGSRKSRGSNKSSLSSKIALLDLKAKRAALEQKIIFSDTIKEQEKALAKLKLQQELSETLAEEAVYQLALNTEDEDNQGELAHLQVVPTGFGNIVDSFEQKLSASIPSHVTNSPAHDTQPPGSVTQSPTSVTQSSGSVTQSPTSVTQSPGSVTQSPTSVTQSPGSVTQSPASVTQSLGSVTQCSTSVTQSSGSVTQFPKSVIQSSTPISISVTQTSALGSRPLVSSVPAVTQSSVSATQSLPTVTQHSVYPEGSYTASTPMTPHGACLTPSLQQGWVTSPWEPSTLRSASITALAACVRFATAR